MLFFFAKDFYHGNWNDVTICDWKLVNRLPSKILYGNILEIEYVISSLQQHYSGYTTNQFHMINLWIITPTTTKTARCWAVMLTNHNIWRMWRECFNVKFYNKLSQCQKGRYVKVFSLFVFVQNSKKKIRPNL